MNSFCWSILPEEEKFFLSLSFCFDADKASVSTLPIISIAASLKLFWNLSHISKYELLTKNTIKLSCLLLLSDLTVSFQRAPLFIFK